MMQSLIYWILRHDRVVLLLTFLVVVAGVWTIGRTPVDALPDLSENQVLVYTPWPGKRPPEIERIITGPLATALQGIPGLVSVRGSSEMGFSLLHLLFNDDVSFLEARQRVQAKLAEIQLELPSDVLPQLAADGIPTGQIFWYTVEGKDTDLVELRRLQESVVAPQMRTIPGVAEVATVGGFNAEYHLQVDFPKLAKAQINLDELADLAFDRPDSFASKTEDLMVTLSSGKRMAVSDVGRIVIGTAPRSGVFEKDGSEVVAGIVHLRYGHNPLTVTRLALDRLQKISDELPPNIRLVPCYDRTPLILGAVQTVAGTLLESMFVTALCVILVLKHWRTSLVISLTLPLAILGAFLSIWLLKVCGITDVQTNIMSLAGIVISIGVLVDSAIVITDNVSHQLREQFGDNPVTGDTRLLVAQACANVGWPAFLAILVMLVSFLPVFALQGIDGRMYGPLAWTKALSLMSVAILTMSVIPVLCHILIRGHVRAESDSVIVQGFANVYRPMLDYLLDHPFPLILFLAATLVLGATTTGNDWLIRLSVAVGLMTCWSTATNYRMNVLSVIVVLIVGLGGSAWIKPIGLSLRVPLDEGMVMDMPITIPNISIAQAGDDLKARNMVLCRFPEVAMVSGKAGRAETAFDPAPLDMIETMVEFQPTYLWPHRRLMRNAAIKQAMAVIVALQDAQLVEASDQLPALANDIVDAGLLRFDSIAREVCWQRQQVMQAELGRDLAIALTQELADRLSQRGFLKTTLTNANVRGMASELAIQDVQRLCKQLDRVTIHVLTKQLLVKMQRYASSTIDESALVSNMTSVRNMYRRIAGMPCVMLAEDLQASLQTIADQRRRTFVQKLNIELRARTAGTWTQIVCSELVLRRPIRDAALRATWNQVLQIRYGVGLKPEQIATHEHSGIPPTSRLPIIDPHRQYDQIVKELTNQFAKHVWLWPHNRGSLTGSGGELDASVLMPGWANVWTRPIQNRVDMLASGVNSEVGLRVMGNDFDQVVETSELIANVIRMVPGAADVIADPIRGKDYTDWLPDEEKLLPLGLKLSDTTDMAVLANQGRLLGNLGAGQDVLPLRVLMMGCSLDSLGELKTTSGPATIKSENGQLRNYVRFNVRNADPSSLISDAKREIASQVSLPPGVTLEWTGQFEHAARTKAMLLWMIPGALLLIGVILYAVFRDAADAALMLTSVPGALAGGALCQWILGVPFSVAVGIGYIACFGMAAATSMVMLVYLRKSIMRAGNLAHLSDGELRIAVLNGAVQRLRPKLLTETTMIFSLVPMLWSTGAGADVIRPMAAPVLGGILVADEVVDLLIPIIFYRIRKRRRKRLIEACSLSKKNKPC